MELAIDAACMAVVAFGIYVTVTGRIRVNKQKEWMGIRARIAGLLVVLVGFGLLFFQSAIWTWQEPWPFWRWLFGRSSN
jgi:hypothetical protein